MIIIYGGTACISTVSIIAGSGWFCPRVIYPYASIIGVLIINIDNEGKLFLDKKQVKSISTVIFCICIDKYINNYSDQYRCNVIGDLIQQYENQTGNKVEFVSFYKDTCHDRQYEGLFNEGDLVVSSFTTYWSDLNAINYYLNTTYQCGENDKKYEDYFLSNDWKHFSNEQIIFDGNTAHICVY